MATPAPPLPNAGTELATPVEVSPLWIQPPWQEKFWRGLMYGVSALSSGIAMSLTLRATQFFFMFGWMSIVVAIVVLLAFLFVSITIHEAGHFLFARHAGMTIARAQIASLEFIAGRTGWRMRWRRAAIKVGGYVIAFADYRRPWRPQMLWLMSGGIAANLAGAALFVAVGTAAHSPWSNLAFAFAAINAGLGIANAFPTRLALPSDGLQLRTWWRGIPENHPDLIAGRVSSASIAGVTADQITDADLAILDAGPLPSQALARWIRLNACQLRGEWTEAVAHGHAFEALLATASPALAKRAADLRWMAQVETAFSQALADGRADALRPLTLNQGADWLAPHRWLRVQALIAAFDGNVSLRDRLLAESARWAEDSVDGAVGVGEERMRGFVRECVATN